MPSLHLHTFDSSALPPLHAEASKGETALLHVNRAAICRQQRYDPRAVITDIPDAEVHRGLYDLVTRGLLPKTVDATAAFEGDVLALTGRASSVPAAPGNPEHTMLPITLHGQVVS